MTTTPSVVELPETWVGSGLLESLNATFKRHFNSTPSFYVRSPGRVNLIGEHIDYCGYAVLPMAIEQCILMAVGQGRTVESPPLLSLVNTDPAYEPFSCTIGEVKVDKTAPAWYNYVLAGFMGIQEHFKLSNPKGMCIVVSGTIPPSAGLSSSSALVCSAALATAHINGLSIPKLGVASLCARSERYVGTEGGGMDQAICFLGEPGKAKLIEFNPLKAFDVRLPCGYVFVIANSLADMNKAATSQYNTRVVECRLASMILAKHLGLEWKDLKILGQLQNTLQVDARTMANHVHEYLHAEPYSQREICDKLGLTDELMAETCLNEKTHHLQEFKLHQRALHVFTESQRVRDFKRICDEGGADAADRLGVLMNQSHESCRDLYECSHPDLDDLVDVALKSGALGSRLTGAGWGGCSVSLVLETEVADFLSKVKEGYYSKDEARRERLDPNLFPSAPGGGAVIYLPRA